MKKRRLKKYSYMKFYYIYIYTQLIHFNESLIEHKKISNYEIISLNVTSHDILSF